MIKSNYYKWFIRLVFSSFVLFGTFTYWSCSNPKQKEEVIGPIDKDTTKTDKPLFQQTMGEYLAGRKDFSTLVTQLERFNLMQTLYDENASLTLFAPNDGAVNSFIAKKGFANFNQFAASVNAESFKYHLLNGKFVAADVATGTLKSLSGSDIYAYQSVNGLYLNGVARVIGQDINLKNGVLHIINQMIEPIQPKTILQILKERGNFSRFITLLEEIGLDSVLNVTGANYTVFAPNNAAFDRSASYLSSLVSARFRNDVVRYHLLNESKFTFEFRDNLVQTFHQRNKSVIIRDGFPNRVDDLTLVADSSDIFALNGVIHIVSELLRPSVQVSDILFYNPDYSDMYEAINRSGLLFDLDRSNFVTLFALNNQAIQDGLTFLGYPGGLNDPFLLQDTLLNLLRYHTILGSRYGTGSLNNRYFKVLNGAYIYTARANDQVSITDASRVGESKIVGSESAVNGIVHFLDRGLVPPRSTIYDIVKNSQSHKILDSIINFSDELRRPTNLKTILDNRAARFLFVVPSDNNFKTLFGLLKSRRTALGSVDSAVWYTQNRGTKHLDTLIDIVRTMLIPATPILVEELPEGVNKVRSLQGYEISLNNRVTQGNRVIEFQGELVGPSQRRSGGRLVLGVPLNTNWQAINGMMMPLQNEAVPITLYPFWR